MGKQGKQKAEIVFDFYFLLFAFLIYKITFSIFAQRAYGEMENARCKVESRKLTRKAEIGKQKIENKPISVFYFLFSQFLTLLSQFSGCEEAGCWEAQASSLPSFLAFSLPSLASFLTCLIPLS